MIDKEDLMSEKKDFGCIFPSIINKLRLVSDSLYQGIENRSIKGAAAIIFEVALDLEAIDKALNGTPGELKEFIERHF